MCFAPVEIKNKLGMRADRKSDTHYLKVPCGDCYECRQSRQNGWIFRLYQEAIVSESAYFVTLTYEDEHLMYNGDGIPSLSRWEIQTFIKKIRRENAKHTDAKLKYYIAGEYGDMTMRPHYHIIMFNLHNELKKDIKLKDGKITDVFTQIWKKGNTTIDECNMATLTYSTKYIMKQRKHRKAFQEVQLEPPFSLMSKGLGLNWLTPEMKRKIHNEVQLFATFNGIKIPLPRYFRDKIFTSNEDKSRVKRETLKYRDEAQHEEAANPEQYCEIIKAKFRKQSENRINKNKGKL